MPSEKIINYYLLCSVDIGKSPHLTNSLNIKELEALLTKREQSDFLKKINGNLIANESIIGGDSTCITEYIDNTSAPGVVFDYRDY